MTFEELNSLFEKIETLNSRLLFALSSDPSEFKVLTAGHFLFGELLVSFPESYFIKTPLNCLHWSN